MLRLAVLLLFTACHDRDEKFTFRSPVIMKQKPDSVSYQRMKVVIDSNRKAFSRQLNIAKPAQRDSIFNLAGNYIVKVIGEDLYSYWKNTPWDFNGTTTTPGSGTIACGYFVTTLLKDAGVRLDRIKLSTCASSVMMKNLTSGRSVRNLSLLSYENFVNEIDKSGKGVYIAGLDFHTGFIVHDGLTLWFIHSNYINRMGVIKEKINESTALRSSKTRYITCLTKSENFLNRWLLN